MKTRHHCSTTYTAWSRKTTPKKGIPCNSPANPNPPLTLFLVQHPNSPERTTPKPKIPENECAASNITACCMHFGSSFSSSKRGFGVGFSVGVRTTALKTRLLRDCTPVHGPQPRIVPPEYVCATMTTTTMMMVMMFSEENKFSEVLPPQKPPWCWVWVFRSGLGRNWEPGIMGGTGDGDKSHKKVILVVYY